MQTSRAICKAAIIVTVVFARQIFEICRKQTTTLGPLAKRNQENQFTIAVTDRYSKLTRVIALPKPVAQHVTMLDPKTLIILYDVPSPVVMDDCLHSVLVKISQCIVRNYGYRAGSAYKMLISNKRPSVKVR